MKKFLSILLSIAMLFTITAGLDFSAFAATYYESEDNDDYYSADYVAANSTIYGICTDSYDEDWYEFTLNSSAKVNVNFSFTRADSDGYWRIHIYKYEGGSSYSELDYEFAYCYDGAFTFNSLGLPAGTYYIHVNSTGSAVGKQYAITPNCTYTSNWETEFNEEYYSADPLSFGTTRYGVCTDGYDEDWYKFTLSSSDRIKVSFSHSKYNSDGYWRVRIYKYEGGSNYSELDYEFVYCYDGTFTFNSLGLPAGTYYIYVNSSGSAAGKQYGVTVNYSVGTPSSVKTATRNTTSLKLSWGRVSGATGYQLQRKTSTGYTGVANTTANYATATGLKPGYAYEFRVRAYRKVNGKYYYSSWRTFKDVTRPNGVSLSGLTAYSSGHKIKASWKKVSGYATGYQVMWAKDKSFRNVVGSNYINGQGNVSYTRANFSKGRNYYVRVRAYRTINGTKYYGAWSNVRYVKAK